MNKHINRLIDLESAIKKKSHFLLGPRQTGKSSAIAKQLPNVKIYDLLLTDVFRKLSYNPAAIREELQDNDKFIVIDEIQKIPELLNEVQWLIEKKRVHFLLTGSSARKLKRYGTNLLGGRARLLKLHPLVSAELGSHFDLNRALQYGLLPSIYFSDDPETDLEAYISLYIQQEIANESLTRNLPAFSRTLEIAALCQAEQTNFTAVANDAQIPRTTVHEYFQILEDTLMIRKLEPWKQNKVRKPVATSKYYFFDWGVARKLQGHDKVTPKSILFGKAFESFLFHELDSFCDYFGKSGSTHKLHYWRTQNGDEVDFLLNDSVAIEAKAKSNLTANDLKGLIRLNEVTKCQHNIIVYLGEARTLTPQPGIKIKALPPHEFLKALWSGEWA